MPKFADLHVHTYLSDGTFSPEKVMEYAKVAGLYAIAITDHDCVDGIAPAMEIAAKLGMEVVPGVELTAEIGDSEIHILGYFVDWQDKIFSKQLNDISEVRKERAKKILEKLRKHAVDLSEDELFQLSGPGSVGRLHIANLLYKKGFISSVSEAFRKYIGNKGCCYVSKFKLTPEDAIAMIKRVGGIPVLAHPKTVYAEDRSREDMIKELVKDGMSGIEVYHSDHKPKDVEEFKGLAEKYNLLMTGGSDCHGFGKRQILIGKVKIPYELVEKMKASIA